MLHRPFFCVKLTSVTPFLCPAPLSVFGTPPLSSLWQTSSLHLHNRAHLCKSWSLRQRQDRSVSGSSYLRSDKSRNFAFKKAGLHLTTTFFKKKKKWLSQKYKLFYFTAKTIDCETRVISVWSFDTVCSASSGNMEVSYDDVCNAILFPLERRSIGCIYSGVGCVTCIHLPNFRELIINSVKYFTIVSLQVSQK